MDIRIPAVGESVVEALLAKWHKADGQLVSKDEPICEIETDKITMDLVAEVSGTLHVQLPAGATLMVGTLIGRIDEAMVSGGVTIASPGDATGAAPATSPEVRQVLREKGLESSQIVGSGPNGRILLEDLKCAGQPGAVRSEEPPLYRPSPFSASPQSASLPVDGEERVRMSPLRKRVAERLVQARQQTAMLTTFNEVDLTALQALRAQLKQQATPIGILPFFARACCDALKAFPAVNARIEGDEIVYQQFCHLGIAVSGEKGLVVPVLRTAERLGLREVEQTIAGFVVKIQTNKLAIADLEGGTFTISNGGTYGSLLSTPIINPPQSGVLGMHAIQERPVVRDGQIVIRPMMYLALSYDHRMIDGREAVGFLKLVKERIEDSAWLDGLR